MEPRTIVVSDALQARLDDHCGATGRTATEVTLAAIEHLGPELDAVVRASRVPLAPPATGERQLGVGPVRVVLRPGAAAARVLDRLSAQLQEPWRVWIPAVLNVYLPGRREPDDMPWLVRD
ncbi:hypothetical protein [Actinomycetospora soli]|uniref:hypothetical protein n=1 Tax=Actinomycetospora soli TaxID=2893887 RepID=UPI001E39F5ED|nr:hypothetical protein [Actinomycetospora soli]MCD2190809.1 hypothetical protein [Actinomycetospora soli]